MERDGGESKDLFTPAQRVGALVLKEALAEYRDNRREDKVEEDFLCYLRLDPDQRAALRNAETRASQVANFRITLAFLVIIWVRFVERVGQGYELTGYDYKNDLDARRIIENFMAEIPAMRPGTEVILRPWDERFRQATVEMDVPRGGSRTSVAGIPVYRSPSEIPWWYFRYPKKPPPEWQDNL